MILSTVAYRCLPVQGPMECWQCGGMTNDPMTSHHVQTHFSTDHGWSQLSWRTVTDRTDRIWTVWGEHMARDCPDGSKGKGKGKAGDRLLFALFCTFDSLVPIVPIRWMLFHEVSRFQMVHWCCNASEALPFSFRASPLSASIVEETTLYGPWILDGMEINTVVWLKVAVFMRKWSPTIFVLDKPNFSSECDLSQGQRLPGGWKEQGQGWQEQGQPGHVVDCWRNCMHPVWKN